MNRRQAWAYLSRVVEGPSRQLQTLFKAGHDAERIAYAIRHRETWIGELLRETAARHDWDRAAADLAACAAAGGRMITPDDEEWPHARLDESFGFAETGRSEHVRSYQADAVPPHVLWVRGQRLDGVIERSVGVVGTRAMSRYGMEATKLLVRGLAQHQWCVVSGGALGVDTTVHETALECGGPTVVIQACGLDRVYPARNKHLIDTIAGVGAVVTEYPPGTPPARHRFLTRNRLVAALTQGTVIVEAAWRSGALNTLSWAEGLGRVAMAVPGPITGAGSLGCHERIRTGRAQMVTSADEVRSLLEAIGVLDVGAQYELQFAGDAIAGLSRTELRLYDALDGVPAETAAVARAAGLPLSLAVHVLVDLAKRNLVQRVGTGWCRPGGDQRNCA
ncbi:DNA-processing protein DprA [Corynebacterium sp.]|uniref:DNA-processing protein DprA n=1 Tax=Corynebacterium sp. TaxID=1720 RepID=UPI0026DAFA79|nr:DNA-processing protein DprA [Corynebacterium sp.]MDO5075816.1 DNA-processing protein DprA [Corynebacterium sp.]